MAQLSASPTPQPSQTDPIFWAATLLKKAGLPDDTISQILGDAAGPALYQVSTPATPAAPLPNRGPERPDAGTFLRGPQSPLPASSIDVTAGAGGAPTINVRDTGATPSVPAPPSGRYGPAPDALVQRQAQMQALAAQLKAQGLSDQQVAARIATLTNPTAAGTTALQGGPPQASAPQPNSPGALQTLAQQFGNWLHGSADPQASAQYRDAQTAQGQRGLQPAAGGGAPAAPEPDGRRLLMQAMFGNQPRQLPPDLFPPPAPDPNAGTAIGAAAGAAAPTHVVMRGPGGGIPPVGGGPQQGPVPVTPGFNNTAPSPDQLSPTQLASIRPAAAQAGRMDVTKTTPTNDWGWEDLLGASLRLMAAGEPAPGATRGPSLLGAIGKAGAGTLAAKQKQRADAAEIGLKGRELDIRQQDVTETSKLRQQLQEYDRTDKEIQRRLQGMTVNTQAYTAISGIRDGYAKELDKLQTSLPYLDALGKDPAAAAKMIKDLQDRRDADIAQVEQGIGASAGTASPTQSAPSKGPGPNSGTGPMIYKTDPVTGKSYQSPGGGKWYEMPPVVS